MSDGLETELGNPEKEHHFEYLEEVALRVRRYIQSLWETKGLRSEQTLGEYLSEMKVANDVSVSLDGWLKEGKLMIVFGCAVEFGQDLEDPSKNDDSVLTAIMDISDSIKRKTTGSPKIAPNLIVLDMEQAL